MKYWRGYLTAAVIGFFTWALMAFAESHTKLIDMVYPYISRMIQGYLTQWTGSVDIVVWQLAVMLFVFGIAALIVMIVIWKWNVIQAAGWVLAAASLVAFLHTGIYGLNQYAGPLAGDIRLNVTEYNASELEAATVYYRDHANALARQARRDSSGNLQFADFDTLADQAGEGFKVLTYEKGYSVFAGDRSPVKKLGWADFMTSTGTLGMHMPLTGEAAVNPHIPGLALPFSMSHEMAHRMCIAKEEDANFAAFLACDANTSADFKYSGYFMAYRYCYNALVRLDPAAAARVQGGCEALLIQDMNSYNQFFSQNQDEQATQVINNVNDTYLKASGDDRGIASYGDVVQLLVSWHIQEVVLPQLEQEEINEFDPYSVLPGQHQTEGESNG